MRRFGILLLAMLALAGCGREKVSSGHGGTKVVLNINWQRLVTESGETCDRCGGTQEELRSAVETLRESLRPLGIEVACAEQSLSTEQCGKDIIGSNRILIQDRPLEDWLGGKVGRSPCGSCCEALGEQVECRTAQVDGASYEVIPAQLIVRAGLLAAAELLRPAGASPCCPGPGGVQSGGDGSPGCGTGESGSS